MKLNQMAAVRLTEVHILTLDWILKHATHSREWNLLV